MGVEPGDGRALRRRSLLGAIALLCLSKPINWVCGVGFELFNRGFQATASGYAKLVGVMLRVFVLVLLLYGGVLGLTYWGFLNTPRGFIPSQDMGYLLVNIQLPDSASLERTQNVIVTMEEIAHKIKGVDATVGVAGQSLLMNAYGSNFGTMFLTLRPFDERTTPETYYEAIANQLRSQIPRVVTDAEVAVFGPPPVRGVGRAGGLHDHDRGPRRPGAAGAPGIHREPSSRAANAAARAQGKHLGVPRQRPPDLSSTSTAPRACSRESTCRMHSRRCRSISGSLYINDFNLFGRTWQVIAQSEARYRDQQRRHQPPAGAERDRHDGAPGRGGQGDARSTDRWCSPGTTCPRPPRSTATRRRGSARAGRSR